MARRTGLSARAAPSSWIATTWFGCRSTSEGGGCASRRCRPSRCRTRGTRPSSGSSWTGSTAGPRPRRRLRTTSRVRRCSSAPSRRRHRVQSWTSKPSWPMREAMADPEGVLSPGDVLGLVVAGGEVEDIGWLQAEAAHAMVIVAADRGAVALENAGVIPHVLVGDLDSADTGTVARLRATGVVVERYPTDKDATDLELAIDVAIRRGATRLRIAGALRQSTEGPPRLDHLFGNLAALAGAVGRVPDTWLVSPDAAATIVTGPGECSLAGAPGDHVSLVALSPTVDGTTTDGLRWALIGASLAWGTTRGVSNEMAGANGRVSVAAGHLLVAVQRHGSPTSLPESCQD
ncbi:MAG: thiamine diphosphokinase [Proteobacteria bacterium]|nr:thiamine diphosphokinase [Pseudomonadota bacterium]